MKRDNSMITQLNPWLLILMLAIPLLIGGASALLTRDSMQVYGAMQKPPLSPPGWLFPVVWTVLYLMMGFASYLVLRSGADRGLVTRALLVYAIQLVLNFFWSLLFFKYSLYLVAFVELAAMWIAVLITTVLFARIRVIAGVMMIPYLFWTTFAAYLNYAVYDLSIIPMPI